MYTPSVNRQKHWSAFVGTVVLLVACSNGSIPQAAPGASMAANPVVGIVTRMNGIPLATNQLGAFWKMQSGAKAGSRAIAKGALVPFGSSHITEYQIPTGNSNPVGIAAGSDGAFWFAEASGNNIGRVTTA